MADKYINADKLKEKIIAEQKNAKIDDIIRDNLSPEPSKESYEERLDYLIHYINTRGIFVRNGKSLYIGMVQGLMCAKALLHENDDMETFEEAVEMWNRRAENG